MKVVARAARFRVRSLRYRALEQELRLLRRHLLPGRFDPTGSYQDRVYTRTIAYRVLAHAEFESYLEDRVQDLCLAAVSAWGQKGKTSKVIACMLAFSGQNMEEPPTTRVPQQPSQQAQWDDKIKVSAKISRSVNALHYAIENNHGIKEENLLRLLLPVGIEADEIDVAWLATLNSFGEERGSVAHLSATNYRTQQLPDPKSEFDRVQYLLQGFKKLDEALNELVP